MTKDYNKRILKMTITAGGNGYENFRTTIPNVFARGLGITKEDNEIELEYQEDKIIIRKLKKL